MTPTLSSSRRLVFEDLRCYTREEAQLANWLASVFPATTEWAGWIQDAFEDFLERPGGLEVRITQRHTVDAAQPELTHAFTKDEIVIGRDEEADISLPERSVAGRHARLSVQAGACVLEDLGASLGTYVNKVRLAPNAPRVLSGGDRFDIFPYSFEVEVRRLWVPDTQVDLVAGTPAPIAWLSFLESASRDRIPLPVTFFPGGTVCVEAGERFLGEFLRRLLSPLEIATARLGLTPTEGALLELLLTSLLERASRDLPFAFHAGPEPPGVRPDLPGDTRGISLPFTIRLLGIAGSFRVFIPCSFRDAAPECPPARDRAVQRLVPCVFPVSAGHVELTVAEMAMLEPGDVVLYTADAELLVPGAPDRGWKVSFAPGNPGQVRIDKYFERPSLTAEGLRPDRADAVEDTRPDLAPLPVRVHVVLGEKELTLAEATALAEGFVFELGMEEAGAVRLAIDGTIAGEGRLVEVEGRLGVRIVSWGTAGAVRNGGGSL